MSTKKQPVTRPAKAAGAGTAKGQSGSKTNSAAAAGRTQANAAGKGQTAAQKRLAAQRAMAAASGKRSARRRRQLLTVWLPIAVVVAVVVAFGIVKLANSNKSNPTTTASSDVVAAVTNVPTSALNAVGAGTASSPPTGLSGAPLTAGGKPRILYVGAEWCPFCAAERWPLAIALSRFGTLTGLGQTASTPNDVYPNTPTLSFHGAKYTSPYIAFSGNEIENGNKQQLDKLDAADQALFANIGHSSFPFIDIGGKWLVSNAQPNPGNLSGKSHADIAKALSDPNSKIGKEILGAANVLTAAICNTTGEKPANVCSSAGVVAGAKKLSPGT
jgi:hypothetical protein